MAGSITNGLVMKTGSHNLVYDRGDAVVVIASDGEEIGRGLVGYRSEDVQRIIGQRREAIMEILGVSVAGPVLHRDDFVKHETS